ncbi:hypothetical protein UlMin_041219 [Ulmus minor]
MITITNTNNLTNSSFSPRTTRLEKKNHHSSIKKEEEDEEIGVFGAEKYFNGAIDDETSSRVSTISSSNNFLHKKDDEQVLTHNQVSAKIDQQLGTPSVRSESSRNSRSILLQSGRRNSSRGKTSKIQGRKLLASLGCKCFHRNSVQVKEFGEISFNQTSTNHNCNDVRPQKITISPIKPVLNLVDPFQINKFPQQVDNFGSGLSRETNLKTHINICKSPEVFGSSPNIKTKSLERRLTMLSLEKSSDHQKHRRSHSDQSDASSDLFEIESLTGKPNTCYPLRVSHDSASGCLTPTGYAPSEASIQWSVVTASAADVSVMSDLEEQIRPTRKSPNLEVNAKTRRRSSSSLLGCKSHKALNVVGDAYIANSVVMKANYESFRSDSPARFQAELTKLSDFNSGLRGQHSIPRLHSPPTSHMLYIQ